MKELKGMLVTVSVNGNRFFHPLNHKDVPGDQYRSARYYRHMEATPGQKYGITVRLNTGHHNSRFAVGIAVDGRSVINGSRIGNAIEQADTWGPSYVFNVDNENGGTIQGWRESTDYVREFVFTDEKKSYAADMFGDLSAVGTIVLAVFREDLPKTMIRLRGVNSRGIGTGVGDIVESSVKPTHFRPKSMAYEIFVIKYDTIEKLKSIGVWTPPETENRFWPAKKQVAGPFCPFKK